MHHIVMFLFATTGGLTLSGIVANVYRILARKPRSLVERLIYLGVMVFAGPSVLIDNATRSFRVQTCSRAAYVFAVGVTAYWSFALGWAAMAIATAA